MRRFALLLLAFSASCHGAFAAEPCGPIRDRMVRLNTQYRSLMADLAAARATLAGLASATDEQKLRAVRGFAFVQRAAEEQRSELLGVYARLMSEGCPSFDEEGYAMTVERFRWHTAEERLQVAEARRLAGHARIAGD